MRATTRNVDGVTIVRLEGELDKLTTDAARLELERAVGGDAVLIDLSSVEFLDSAGLHVLFRLARAASKTGGRLAIVIPEASPLRRLVEITNVDEIAPLCDSVDDGVARIRAVSAASDTGTGGGDEPH